MDAQQRLLLEAAHEGLACGQPSATAAPAQVWLAGNPPASSGDGSQLLDEAVLDGVAARCQMHSILQTTGHMPG